MRKLNLKHYRQRLLQLRSLLQGDLKSLMDAALAGREGWGSRMPTHMAENGTAAAEVDCALLLTASEQATLRLIDAALERIDDGTYGKCLATGKPIAKARLDAIPYAEYCIEYAAQADSTGSPR